FIENVGALLGVVNGRMRGDLQRFKDLVESGGHDTGWHDPAERSSAAADRDRQVGEAQRSVHRDDVGYENSDRGGIAREHDMNRDMIRDMDLDRDPSRDANRGLAGGRDRADAVAGGAI